MRREERTRKKMVEFTAAILIDLCGNFHLKFGLKPQTTEDN